MADKKALKKLNKEKLIIFAHENCDGMELKDEMLKGEMIDYILNWEPAEKVDIIESSEKYTPLDNFETWFAEWLQTVDIESKHNPEAHGCLGGLPQCDLCDTKMPTAKKIWESQ